MDIKRVTSKMFEKNLTDLVRGIRNNKSNEVLYGLAFHSHEHVAIMSGRRGIIYFLSVYLFVYYAVLCIHLSISVVCTFKGHIVLI